MEGKEKKKLKEWKIASPKDRTRVFLLLLQKLFVKLVFGPVSI